MTNLDIIDFNEMRTKFEQGIFKFGTNERVWIKVSNSQLSASCPEFISSEEGSLRELIYNQEYLDGGVILVNATNKVNGVLNGNPNWVDGVIDNYIVHEYCTYYGYENLVFNEELKNTQESIEG